MKKHGLSNHKLYYIWKNFKARCNNPNNPDYENYGGRGIKVCNSWLDFENFYNWAIRTGYSEDLEIDRKDNNRGYEPLNCRQVNHIEQCNNKRDNLLITINNITKTLTNWARKYNISSELVRSRLRIGWSIEKALNIETNKNDS